MTSDEIKKVIFGYDKIENVVEDFSNVIGATTDSVLRSVPTNNDAQTKYVSRIGSDVNSGTRAAPYRTIDYAHSQLSATFFNLAIDDSNEYNEDLHLLSFGLNYKLFSTAGNTPKIKFNFGVRINSVRTVNIGTTYFVASSNIDSSDANAGTDSSFPLITIGQAITNALDGDTIQIDDNAVYQEALTIPSTYALLIKSKFGKSPTIKFIPNGNDAVIHWASTSNKTVTFEGIIFDGDGNTDSICINAVPASFGISHRLNVYSCEFKNFKEGVFCNGMDKVFIKYCYIHNSVGGIGAGIRNRGIYLLNSTAVTVTEWKIEWNKIHDITGLDSTPSAYISDGIRVEANTNPVTTLAILNNYVYNCTGTCIVEASLSSGTLCSVESNSCLGGNINTNNYVLQNDAGWSTYNVTNNIAEGEVATKHFFAVAALTITYCYSDQTKQTNITFGTGCIDGIDPGYSSISLVTGVKLGLKPDSLCRRSGFGSVDIGARIYMIFILNDGFEINGIIFDGNDDVQKAIEITDKETAKIKWNDFTKFIGVAVNSGYEGLTASTNHIIENNSFYKNTTGLSKQDGVSDSHDYNEFYRNSIAGVWENGAGASLEHCSFYGNKYGAYIGIGCTSLIFTNNAFQDDTIYSIFSESLVFTPTYCCINGTVNVNVDVSDPTNIFITPLFINTNIGEEDLRLRTLASGFTYTSPCKGAGSSDIGVWQSVVTVDAPSFTQFVLLNNPHEFNITFAKKVTQEQYTDFGDYDPYIKFLKRIIEMKWQTSDYSPDEQTEILEYISTLTSPIRIWLLGGDAIADGTAGVIDALALTLTDATLNLRPNALKGWWVTVQSWDFHILSNTKTVLTLDDPFNKLSNDFALVWTIKFLEMLPNVRKKFSGKRPAFFLEMYRTGYSLGFIEV